MILLTEKEIKQIINSELLEVDEIELSIDLGKSLSKFKIKKGIIDFHSEKININEFKKLKLKKNNVYFVEDSEVRKFYFFSETRKRSYKIIPTKTWPTLTLDSTPMHRFTLIDPKKDTQLKIKVIKPVKGIVLDTCFGLGYTAILASKHAEKVYTFEEDSNVIEISKVNPFSAKVFESENIILSNKDIFFEIKKFQDNYFDRIIHDPPTVKYAGELYSNEFYSELYRVLKKKGIGYMYVPRPGVSKNKKGLEIAMQKRLKKIGFKTEFLIESQAIKIEKI